MVKITQYSEAKEVAVTLTLKALEQYGTGESEGWITYKLLVERGGATLTQTDGTILDVDVASIIEACQSDIQKAVSVEPLEPDFEIRLNRIDDETIEFICFIDETHVKHGYYDTPNVGVKFEVTPNELKSFGTTLNDELNKITG